MILINDIANFGRGRDKQPRKKRNALIGAIGGSAIGAGIGYATKPSKYKLAANKRYKDELIYATNRLKDKIGDPYYENTEHLQKHKDTIKYYKDNKNNIINGYEYHAKGHDLVGEVGWNQNNKKQLDRFGKLSNKIGSKRALIGSGVGLAAGLGGAYLYNRLKNDNSKRR
jgi:hypothetical protein